MNFTAGVWLSLLALTLVSFWLGGGDGSSPYLTLVALGVTLLKGQLIVDVFMGLGQVRWLWRGLLWGYLVLVLGLIALAYLA